MRWFIRDRKGQLGTPLKVLIGIMCVAVVGGILTLGYFAYQQSAVPDRDTGSKDPGTPKVPVPESKKGELTSRTFYAYDRSADNQNTAVKVPYYVWEKGVSDLTVDGTVLSTSGTSTDLKKDSTYIGIGFNGTFLGIEKEVPVGNEETGTVALDVYRNCKGLSILLYDSAYNTNQNLTMSAGQTKSFNYMEVENNNTNCGFNLKGFYVDKQSYGNVSAIQIKSNPNYNSIEATSIGLQRINEQDDFVYVLPKPSLLLEGEKWLSGTVSVTAGGSDPVKRDCYQVFAFDEAPFKSAKSGAIPPIKWGIEDDQLSPAQVGANDFEAKSTGNSGDTFCVN